MNVDLKTSFNDLSAPDIGLEEEEIKEERNECQPNLEVTDHEPKPKQKSALLT